MSAVGEVRAEQSFGDYDGQDVSGISISISKATGLTADSILLDYRVYANILG